MEDTRRRNFDLDFDLDSQLCAMTKLQIHYSTIVFESSTYVSSIVRYMQKTRHFTICHATCVSQPCCLPSVATCHCILHVDFALLCFALHRECICSRTICSHSAPGDLKQKQLVHASVAQHIPFRCVPNGTEWRYAVYSRCVGMRYVGCRFYKVSSWLFDT